MTHKTLGLAAMVLMLFALLGAIWLQPKTTQSVESPVAATVEQTASTVQPSSPAPQTKFGKLNEAEVRQKALEVIAQAIEVRTELRDRKTPEDYERHAKQKLKRYAELFRSWNLDSEVITESLEVLAHRNQELADIDNQMLDKRINPFAAAKETIACREKFQTQLSTLIGPERSAQFKAWEKPSNRRNKPVID